MVMKEMKDNVDVEAPRRRHPYLTGNFAPVHTTTPLTPCTYSGVIPSELVGGEYIRNGGNPVTNEDLGREAHWFDGDGMLSGVLFRRTEKGTVRPEFANQYILTDVYLSSISSPRLQTPILPSIAIMVNPMTTILTTILRVLRTLLLVILSHLPGSRQAITRISVANTSLIYHDGRALATCESGPPMHIALPGLETVDWYHGQMDLDRGKNQQAQDPGFRETGIFASMREWTTAHPRNDPKTGELILYHSTFIPPYVNYSILKSTYDPKTRSDVPAADRVFHAAVPGISSPKMMHDFGASHTHTVIMDLPLSLNPFNTVRNKPVIAYDPRSRSRFGVFPRYRPQDVRWFETKACCIFHTANTWNTSTIGGSADLDTEMVNLLACRLNSASIVFSAGDIAAPQPISDLPPHEQEDEQSRLYYYQFELSKSKSSNPVLHQWALSAISFEFPSLRDSSAMSAAKYIYGCSVSGASFGAALGRSVKIDSLVKVDVETLIARGKQNPPTQVIGCVDTRTVDEILASDDPHEPIKIFKMPRGWYAQESRFVPRQNGISEDDGWILSYVFDESQLAINGECRGGSRSELWIIDAVSMTDVVAKVHLPQRVPYGMHGNWFSEEDIKSQRPVESLRSILIPEKALAAASTAEQAWMATRKALEGFLA